MEKHAPSGSPSSAAFTESGVIRRSRRVRSCTSEMVTSKPATSRNSKVSMIFLAIAGTMTPYAVFVLLPIKAWVGWTMLGVAWGAVAIGISLTMTLFEKTKWLQMVLYLAVGWSTLLTMKYLYEFFPRTGLILLVAGGIVYTVGAILYGIGKKKKYFHFVFHIFIVAASVLHFLSIYIYVFPFNIS